MEESRLWYAKGPKVNVGAPDREDVESSAVGDDLDAASPGIDEPAPDWAEQSHRSELFHSAQLSFGHSSVASSVFQSAVQYPMDRSLARSRIHGFPLTEEDGEQESRASDADSFFSASEDDDAHHDDEQEAPLASQSPRLSASTGAGQFQAAAQTGVDRSADSGWATPIGWFVLWV